jgi:hypothetical protein
MPQYIHREFRRKKHHQRRGWVIRRIIMVFRFMSGGAIAALAGAAMLALLSAPSFAFTLSSPSAERQVVNAEIHDAYWHHWGWHHWGWHHWHHWRHWY